MSETEMLEKEFSDACAKVEVGSADQATISSLLMPLRSKSPITHAHYLHSLRVAHTSRAIAQFQHLEEKPALYAGALHDIGKALVPLEVLGETEKWTLWHQQEMSKHVLDGYRLLRGRFDFTAEIMLWHHRFQIAKYPNKLPALMHDYSESTKLLIVEYGRILAIADVYDALHRPNSKFGNQLSKDEIREKMMEFNPDRKGLVAARYDAEILT